MTAALPSSFAASNSVSASRGTDKAGSVNNFSNSYFDEVTARRMWFRDLLWKAFPNEPSDTERARKASKVLSRRGKPVSERQVRNWLSLKNDATLGYVLLVLAIAKAEIVFNRVEGDQ